MNVSRHLVKICVMNLRLFHLSVCAGHDAVFSTANVSAHSAAERFAALEERDKFLRSSMIASLL